MNFSKILKIPAQSKCISRTFLIVRIVAGLAFMFHGWGKIQNPMGWMGPDAPVPGIFQFLAALAEFGGGLAWIIGLLVPIASFGLVCTMAVAAMTHMFVMGDPFVASGPGQGSYELAAVYLTIAIMLMLNGPGKFSLDSKVFGER
jgi:putative oxidoreductase